MLFSQLAERHAQHLRAKRRAPLTILWYQQQFAAYDTWRIAHNLPDVIPDLDTLDAFFAELNDPARDPPLAARTVHARFRALRAILIYGERRRRLYGYDDNPIHAMEAPEVPRKRQPHVTWEYFQRVLRTTHRENATWIDHRDRLILLVLYFSGLRVGELCGLRVVDINRERLEIDIATAKGGDSRVAPTAPVVITALGDYLFSRPVQSPHLWLSATSHGNARGILTPVGVRMMLNRRYDEVGIPVDERLSAHKYRHGFAMWLRANGADLPDISAGMGHSSTRVTEEVYAFTLPQRVKSAYNTALAKLEARTRG